MTRSVLITGATGVVGSAVTPLFLNEADTEVWLLIRAADDGELQKRLDGLFDYWGEEITEPAARSRVRPVRGDVSEPNLGLASAEYGAMAGRLTHIVHAAASVKMNMSEAEARRSSVDSVQHIVKLADTCRTCGQFRKLDYVSTLGIAGRMSGLIPERPLTEPRAFHNTYESSKAKAETLVLDAMDAGLPATIHRPSMIVGSSRTGKIIHFQVFYYLVRFLSGAHTFGIVPRIEGVRLDMVTSDYVAAAIHWSSGADTATGRILHLCSGPDLAMPITDLMQEVRWIMAQLGDRLAPLHQVPVPVFLTVLGALRCLSGERTRRRLANLSLFLDYMDDRQVFENRYSQTALLAAGINVLPPSKYLQKTLEYHRDDSNSGEHVAPTAR